MSENNFRASKIRSNIPSVQLRLAKIYAISKLREGITCMKACSFSRDEIIRLATEFTENTNYEYQEKD